MTAGPHPHTIYFVVPVGEAGKPANAWHVAAVAAQLAPLNAHLVEDPALCHGLTRYLIRTMAAERRRLIDQEAP